MPAAWAAAPVTAPALFAPERVNDTQTMTPVGPKAKGPHVLRAQILLDRARFSPGEIDGAYGSNMEKAIAAYQRSNRLTVSGTVDAPTWAALNRDPAQALVTYRIAEADVAGPFTAIPSDMIEKAKLPALGYASALEALGEKFHASPRLLRELNADKDLSRAGVDMLVPNVDAPAPLPKAAKVIVDKSDSSVTLVDAAGTTLAHFPASTGSQHDPLPLGLWKINGVARNPVFHYNPKLFWDAKAGHEKARIPAGPNNPVGVVWVDLSKDHYGIHGTPDPSRIGRTQSHGCIRLTNWDARALADAVAPGTPALLQE
ncbi:MAG TPA: L,D-transpeptidase [Opitutaceae bacterium]|nr:L,D-transpeptidase [Opitutaceae bacterium]